MALLDWLHRRGAVPAGAEANWQVWVEDDFLVVTHEDGTEFARQLVGGARNVRVVPLARGNHHLRASGWQITLAQTAGDALVGPPLPDWQSAHLLAQRVCKATQLPMDETTARLFSRVGRLQL